VLPGGVGRVGRAWKRFSRPFRVTRIQRPSLLSV
jgi:hypothetical protein